MTESAPKVVSTRITKKDGEYIVKAYDGNGKRLPSCDYFTTDKGDAEQTARAMVSDPRETWPHLS
jgi:hypothetical protein